LRGNNVTSKYTMQRFDDNKNHKVDFQVMNTYIKLNVDDKHEIRADGDFINFWVKNSKAYLGGFSRDIDYHKV
jgi:hypothetical protein